jgi:hypothetical protein
MGKPRLLRLTVLLVIAVILFLWRNQRLSLKREIVAKFPAGVNRLVVTDLDGDGEAELVATCTLAQFDCNPITVGLTQSQFTDPRIWLILSPLSNPSIQRLPYACRLPFPNFLPPLRKLPVEEVKAVKLRFSQIWEFGDFGWLTMHSGRLKFESLFSRPGKLNCQMVLLQGIFNLAVNFERQSNSPHQKIRKQHLGYSILADGQWTLTGFKGLKTTSWGTEEYGDFDGDGNVDVLKPSYTWNRPSRITVHWGNGAPPTTLLYNFGGLSGTKFLADDIDGDGRWEVVTCGRQLTIWKFTGGQFVPVAEIRLKLPPSSQTYKSVSSQPLTKNQPPQSSPPQILPTPLPLPVLDEISTVDLDGDGLKEFWLVWRKPILVDVIDPVRYPLPSPQLVALQVIWWDGQELRTKWFAPKETMLSSAPKFVLEFEGQRYAIALKAYQRLAHHFQMSLRPLRVQLWKQVTQSYWGIFRLPQGKSAYELPQWVEVAKLPAPPVSIGDWDEDGKQELLLKRSLVERDSTPHATHPQDILYLAHFDGRKVRWAQWTHVPLNGSKFSASSIVVVKGRQGTAIFVLWDKVFESVLEKVRWR